MNTLMHKIIETLTELRMGFAGELTMSDAMETLMDCLFMNRVPGVWADLAWPSKRALSTWLVDMVKRCAQLRSWTEAPSQIPMCTWISGLINPQSFLTAIMQQSAQTDQKELDKLRIWTEVCTCGAHCGCRGCSSARARAPCASACLPARNARHCPAPLGVMDGTTYSSTLVHTSACSAPDAHGR